MACRHRPLAASRAERQTRLHGFLAFALVLTCRDLAHLVLRTLHLHTTPEKSVSTKYCTVLYLTTPVLFAADFVPLGHPLHYHCSPTCFYPIPHASSSSSHTHHYHSPNKPKQRRPPRPKAPKGKKSPPADRRNSTPVLHSHQLALSNLSSKSFIAFFSPASSASAFRLRYEMIL